MAKGNLTQNLASLLLALLVYPPPGLGQGSGPADFGWLNHLITGAWLAFWFGVVIYPGALLVFIVWYLVAAETDKNRESPGAGKKIAAVARWAVITHLSLTLAATLFFAFN